MKSYISPMFLSYDYYSKAIYPYRNKKDYGEHGPSMKGKRYLTNLTTSILLRFFSLISIFPIVGIGMLTLYKNEGYAEAGVKLLTFLKDALTGTMFTDVTSNLLFKMAGIWAVILLFCFYSSAKLKSKIDFSELDIDDRNYVMNSKVVSFLNE